MTVEYFGIRAVGNNDNKVAFVFLFSAGFGVLDIDDLVVESYDSVDCGEGFGIDKG